MKSYAEFEAEAKEMTADSTVDEINAGGGEAIGIEIDVRDRASVDAMVQKVCDTWGRVDILAANVPYVPSGEVGLLPPEARAHEPRMALDGGTDGLEVLRRVAAAAPLWLAPGGHLLAETSETELLALVEALNADPSVHGILVQLPLPAHIDSARVLEAIAPMKDVDGVHPVNVGLLSIGDTSRALIPCTPAGAMILIDRACARLRRSLQPHSIRRLVAPSQPQRRTPLSWPYSGMPSRPLSPAVSMIARPTTPRGPSRTRRTMTRR